MNPYLKALRLPICILAGLLAIIGFRLSNFPISWMAVIAVVFISCSIMLQNDWRDRYHDILKGKILASSRPRAFLSFLLIFWIISLILIIIVAMDNIYISGGLVVMVFIGLVYSELRRVPMASNISVAIMFSVPVLSAALGNIDNQRMWLFFLSAALMLFGREVSKDIDDATIDNDYKWTIPLAIGKKKAKSITALTTLSGYIIVSAIFPLILCGAPFLIISTVSLFSQNNLRVSRVYMDIGIAIAMIIIIVLK